MKTIIKFVDKYSKQHFSFWHSTISSFKETRTKGPFWFDSRDHEQKLRRNLTLFLTLGLVRFSDEFSRLLSSSFSTRTSGECSLSTLWHAVRCLLIRLFGLNRLSRANSTLSKLSESCVVAAASIDFGVLGVANKVVEAVEDIFVFVQLCISFIFEYRACCSNLIWYWLTGTIQIALGQEYIDLIQELNFVYCFDGAEDRGKEQALAINELRFSGWFKNLGREFGKFCHS